MKLRRRSKAGHNGEPPMRELRDASTFWLNPLSTKLDKNGKRYRVPRKLVHNAKLKADFTP